MIKNRFRHVVVRRVHLRKELKPVEVSWRFSNGAEPDWAVIVHVVDEGQYESYDLQLLKEMTSAGEPCKSSVALVGSIGYETLRIAKAQAHADLGVEYVEWEPCRIEISGADGQVDWTKAVPVAEQGAAGNSR